MNGREEGREPGGGEKKKKKKKRSWCCCYNVFRNVTLCAPFPTPPAGIVWLKKAFTSSLFIGESQLCHGTHDGQLGGLSKLPSNQPRHILELPMVGVGVAVRCRCHSTLRGYDDKTVVIPGGGMVRIDRDTYDVRGARKVKSNMLDGRMTRKDGSPRHPPGSIRSMKEADSLSTASFFFVFMLSNGSAILS